MMKMFVLCLALVGLMVPALAQKPTSPNGKLSLETVGEGLRLSYQNQPVLDIPEIGFEGVSAKPEFRFVRKVTANVCMPSMRPMNMRRLSVRPGRWWSDSITTAWLSATN